MSSDLLRLVKLKIHFFLLSHLEQGEKNHIEIKQLNKDMQCWINSTVLECIEKQTL